MFYVTILYCNSICDICAESLVPFDQIFAAICCCNSRNIPILWRILRSKFAQYYKFFYGIDP